MRSTNSCRSLLAFHTQRPGAHQSLIEQVFFVVVGHAASVVRAGFAVAVDAAPVHHLRRPGRGISESTSRRARTSSLRLVSWVEVASIEYGQCSRAQLVAAMEFVQRNAELRRRAADLIHRNEAGVDVAGCVLQAFGHHRAGELLELQGEVQLPAVAVDRRVAVLALQQQDAPQKVEHRGANAAVAPLGPGDRLLDVLRSRSLTLPRSSM